MRTISDGERRTMTGEVRSPYNNPPPSQTFCEPSTFGHGRRLCNYRAYYLSPAPMAFPQSAFSACGRDTSRKRLTTPYPPSDIGFVRKRYTAAFHTFCIITQVRLNYMQYLVFCEPSRSLSRRLPARCQTKCCEHASNAHEQRSAVRSSIYWYHLNSGFK
jgi:hypothetical protein